MLVEGDLTGEIIGAAIEVHRYWGPGLCESIYEKSLSNELECRGIAFEAQMEIPLIYKDAIIGDSLRLDLFVEKKVVVENKAIAELLPVHDAQLLTYMKLVGCRIGLLINFNVPVLKDGIRRRIL